MGQKAKGAAKFTSEAMRTLAQDYMDVKQRYYAQQAEIVSEVVKTAGMILQSLLFSNIYQHF